MYLNAELANVYSVKCFLYPMQYLQLSFKLNLFSWFGLYVPECSLANVYLVEWKLRMCWSILSNIISCELFMQCYFLMGWLNVLTLVLSEFSILIWITLLSWNKWPKDRLSICNNAPHNHTSTLQITFFSSTWLSPKAFSNLVGQ